MTTLIVLAKECIPGKVKTRLHPPFTLEQAAEIAAASLHDTLDALATLPATRRVLCFDGTTPPAAAVGYEVIHQVEGDLDDRLAAIFDAVDGPAVLVGMDTPQLDAGVLAEAIAPWPDDVDAWFGPASDGGFWLLGLAALPSRGDLIRGVPMSRDDTGALQRARLTDAGLDVRDLPTLLDVDDADALARVVATIPGSRTARAASRARSAIRADQGERTNADDAGEEVDRVEPRGRPRR